MLARVAIEEKRWNFCGILYEIMEDRKQYWIFYKIGYDVLIGLGIA
jgi:hypothetical protein